MDRQEYSKFDFKNLAMWKNMQLFRRGE